MSVLQKLKQPRRSKVDQKLLTHPVGIGSMNSFKGRLDKLRRTRMGFLWIRHGLQSPRPNGDWTPVRPHKVSYKVRRKLQLFGHVWRMDDDRLVKTVMLGMVDGDRTRGRPPRRWVDDIIDWCGCTLPATVHLNRMEREDWQCCCWPRRPIWAMSAWMDGWIHVAICENVAMINPVNFEIARPKFGPLRL